MSNEGIDPFDRVFSRPELSDAEKLVFYAILKSCGPSGESALFDQEIADRVGKSINTAQRCVGLLIKKGFIERRGGGTFRRRLAIADPPPERLASKDGGV